MGTIAGDDTVLIICRSSAAMEKVIKRLKSVAGPHPV
jgi:arginine repressor